MDVYAQADLRPEQKELFKLPRIRVFVLAIKILLCDAV